MYVWELPYQRCLTHGSSFLKFRDESFRGGSNVTFVERLMNLVKELIIRQHQLRILLSLLYLGQFISRTVNPQAQVHYSQHVREIL